MRFEEAQDGYQQRWFGCSAAKLVSPDSGQVEEPLRPALLTKRLGKRGEAERNRVIWCPGVHGLEVREVVEGCKVGEDPDRRRQCTEH
jgi:hypothetical protein